MKCTEVRERLVEFLDGELAPSDREDVQRHLADCTPCQKEVAMIEMEQQMLHQVALTPAPDDMGQRVMAALKAQAARAPRKKSQPWWAFLMRPQFAMAGGLAAVICVALLWTPGAPTPMEPPAGNAVRFASLSVERGTVDCVLDGKTRSLASGDELELRPGTELACASNSRARLSFPQRGTVALGASTELVVDRDQLHLAKGFLHVDYTGGQGQEFGVVTPNASLLPLGTNYLVACGEGRTLTAINEGKVYFDGKSAGAMALDPGQGVRLHGGSLEAFAFTGALNSLDALEEAATRTRRAVDLTGTPGSSSTGKPLGGTTPQGGRDLGDLVDRD